LIAQWSGGWLASR
jgi:hypothetical protein